MQPRLHIYILAVQQLVSEARAGVSCKMRLPLALMVLSAFLSCCVGKDKYNILIAVPVASKSLHHLFSSLGAGLSDAGHSVTMFTSFNQTKKHQNLVHFQPGDFSAPIARKPDNIFFNHSFQILMEWGIKANEEVIDSMWNNDDVWQLWERRNDFDAIITPSYANEPVLMLLNGFKGAYIMVCTPGVEYFSIARSGHWLPASVVPAILSPYDEYMTFWERSANLFNIFIIQIPLDLIPKNRMKEQLQQYHPDVQDLLSYYERASLTLINGHFALDGPVPLLPNQVEIGTINAEKPKPLPADLEEFMQGSGDAGVIYFSLGSFVMGKEIPQFLKDILVEAFRRVPQRVVWKYEENDLDLPPNVITRKWLPQQDILGHPKTRIFMSHCGNLGTQEAKYHGVPVLAVPVAFDQPRNAARLARKEYGVIVNWSEMTVDKLVDAIHTLTKDNTYYDRMKSVSRILQDQKDTPAERAVWWVEYVIRHKGAPHLQYAGQRLSLFQYIMLDVILFWGAVFSLVGYVFIRICKAVLGLCFGTSSKVKRE